MLGESTLRRDSTGLRRKGKKRCISVTKMK